MRDDDLDRIFSRVAAKEEIVPSSGFTASVMEAVQHEASTPPPIPFPWTRALPGMIAAAVTLVLVIVEEAAYSGHEATFPQLSFNWLYTAINFGAGWILLALLLSLAPIMLSIYLVSGKSLKQALPSFWAMANRS